MMILDPEGEQLELSFAQWQTRYARIPWGGLSPRDLTRGSKIVILKARAGGGMSDVIPDRQLVFDFYKRGAVPQSVTAPLLFEGPRY